MAAVLLLQAVKTCNNGLVAYEVALSLHRLLTKFGNDLQAVTWDSLLELLTALLHNISVRD